MQMTDDEIRTSYVQAKDKAAQVTVLADLNVVPVSDMEQKLVELGLMEISFDYVRCAQLYAEGKTDLEIAEMMGQPKTRVVKWRKSKGFRANYPAQEKRKARKPQGQQSKPVEPVKVPAAEKPPIGIMPEAIWRQQRYDDLCRAITRYVVAGLKPLPEWIDEARRFGEAMTKE